MSLRSGLHIDRIFTRSRRFRLGHATGPAFFERWDGGAASPPVVLRRTTHRR